ncbi:Cholecystokinin receptor [Aphelenchoides besseyi]|nr:Cholecystokinin receptor [Aphelenchoides besseyi]
MAGDFCEIGSIPLSNETWAPIVQMVAVFQRSYGQIHPFVATMLCAVGTIMNFITVVVLTRPTMLSPVNVLLCAVAICDILVMTSTLIFVVHFHFVADSRCEVSDYSYGWAIFTIVHAHVSVIFHATSIWLTVSLAQIRVLTIRRATSGPTTSITERFSIVLAIVTFIVMTAVNLPNFLTFEVDEVPAEMYLSCMQTDSDENVFSAMSNGSWAYAVRAHEKDCMKLKMAFWSNGMIFKVVPCLLLTVSIVALLKIIADVSNKRKNLAQVMKKKVPKDHTTPMLVAVLSIFLLAELPQGIFLVMSGIFSSEVFKKKIYLPLGDFMDFLSLLNSAIGFLIYVAMSRKFRSVFFQLFFSLLHCSPYYGDSDWSAAEPELSETLQLLDAQLGEGAKKGSPQQSLLARFYGCGIDCIFTFCHCFCTARARRVRRNQRKLSMHHSQRGKRTPLNVNKRSASTRQRSIPLIVAAATGTSVTELTRKSLSNVFNSSIAPPSIIGPSAFFAKPRKQRALANRTMSLAPTSSTRRLQFGSPPPRSPRHSFGSNAIRPGSASAKSTRRPTPLQWTPRELPLQYTRRERKLRCHLPSTREVRRALNSSKRVGRRRSDGDQIFVAATSALRQRLEQRDTNNNRNQLEETKDAGTSGNNWRSTVFGFLDLIARFGRRNPNDLQSAIAKKRTIPRFILQDPTINERSDEDEDAELDAKANAHLTTRRYRHSDVGRTDALSRLRSGDTRPFNPVVGSTSTANGMFLNVDSLADQRRWSRITTNSTSFGTDPCGVSSFVVGGEMSGLFGGEIEREASTFSDYYERLCGRRESRFTATTTAIEVDGPTRTDQGISLLSPRNADQTSQLKRSQPLSPNLLTVPMETLDAKRLSLFSNITSADPTSTQCSHAPLVAVPSSFRHSKRSTQQFNSQRHYWNESVNGVFTRFGSWWSERRIVTATRPRASHPFSSLWRLIRDRASTWNSNSTHREPNETPQTPRTRVGQLRAETSFPGVIY